MATKKKVTRKKTAKKKTAARRPRARASAGDDVITDENVYETGTGERIAAESGSGPGVKQEAGDGPEETMRGRFYRPVTDIYETGDALILVTELPGVTPEGLSVHVDRDVLSVHARVEIGNYEGLSPLYTEYNVGHFARRFRLPGSVDPDGIEARLNDGLLVLELAKARAYRKRRIPVR